jgi:hypothetical protein
MSKTITVVAITIIILPVVLGISLFIKQKIVSDQTFQPEAYSRTNDTNFAYSYNSAQLTGDIR